jgi:tetratricopeptide (TPR) repeat protein
MGVRYVLLNYVTSEYLSRYWNQVYSWRPEELARAWEYWRRYGEIVWRSARPDGVNGGYVLYRLHDRSGTPPVLMPFLPGAEMAGIREGSEEVAAYAWRLEMLEQFVSGVVFFEVRRATALLNAGRARDALAVATRALACDYPEQDVLHGVRAEALKRLGRYPEALAAARRAEALQPGERVYVRLREECERLAQDRGGR